MSMILRKMSQDFLERKVRWSEKGRLAVFTGSIEKIDKTGIILDEFVENLMMRRVGEKFVDRVVDVFEVRVGSLAMTGPVRPVRTFRWMRPLRWVRSFGKLGAVGKFGPVREFRTIWKFRTVRKFRREFRRVECSTKYTPLGRSR